MLDGSEARPEWVLIELSCDTFTPRCNVAALSIGPSEILIIGGQIGTQEEGWKKGVPEGMSDIHILNTDSDTLTREVEKGYDYGLTCLSNQCQLMDDGSVACLF